jgi:hypothetical protein
LAEATGRLSEAAVAAVERLRALVDDGDPAIALRASTAILDTLTKYREFSDLAARVADVEEHLAEQRSSRRAASRVGWGA